MASATAGRIGEGMEPRTPQIFTRMKEPLYFPAGVPMRKTVSAGVVVLGPDGRVLVVSQHGTSWSLPKGHVEPGEDLPTAARRETWEEAGIDQLELGEALGDYTRPKISKTGGDDASELKHIHFFLGRTTQTALAPRDGENPEARWVARTDVESLLTHQADKEFWRSVLPRLPER